MHQPPPDDVRYVEVKPSEPAYRKVIKWVIAAIAGAVIASLLGWVSPRLVYGWPPGWTDPDAVAADKELEGFASTLEMVLITSQPHRGDLADVSRGINDCTYWPDYAVTRVQGVLDDRGAALDGLKNNPAPTPGVELAQRAFSAYLASMKADTDLIDWLKEVKRDYPGEKPCDHRDGAQYQAYIEDSYNATAAKKRFVAAFNPVARRFGFAPPNWQSSQF